MNPTKYMFLAFVVTLVMMPLSAVGQDVQALLDRIERLERDIRTLNTQISRGAGAVVETGEDSNLSGDSMFSGAGIARIDARITSLENDLRAATGSFEDLEHSVYTLSTTLDKLVGDVDFRLSELEQKLNDSPLARADMQLGLAGSSGVSTPQISTVVPAGNVTRVMTRADDGVLGTMTESELLQGVAEVVPARESVPETQSATGTPVAGSEAVVETATVAPAVTDAVPSPRDQYTQAFGLLRQAKYDDAAIALQAFVNQYPDDPLVANAQYWLGETFYVRSEFVRAAEVFFEGYRTAPDGPKAPDTLLKLGMSLGNLGKKPEACAAFTKLASDFPNASENVRKTMERERLRNGC